MSRRAPPDAKRVCVAAWRLPAARQQAFVERVCGENAALRAEVEALRAARASLEREGTFLRTLRDVLAPRRDATPARTAALTPGTRVAGRYVVESLLGEGSSGRVYVARDDVGRASVALKVFDSADDLPRVRREAITLRHLRVPGVVSLLDDGVDEGRAFIAMAKADGRPFPGTQGRVAWPSICGAACALLETVGRIHRHGVVHGDLKPTNVLVSDAGRVTVLDVGIASGPSIDFAGSRGAQVEGTPCYMAPERIAGGPPSVSADLYAVGVMLFEALCGEPPHDAKTVEELFARRCHEPAARVRTQVPDIPLEAAALIDDLLEHDPSRRPASASAAAERIAPRRAPRPGEPGHAFLGPRTLVDELVRAAGESRSLRIFGPPRSGRSRTLEEAAAALRRSGVRVVELAASAVPFGSLAPLPGSEVGWREADVAAAVRAVEERLTTLLAAGTVLVADGIDVSIDRWTAGALATCTAGGCVLSSSSSRADGAREVPRLSPSDLEPLFAGRNRVFHLPEDAGRILAAATGGLAGRAIEELAVWERAGLGAWEGGRLRVTRDALERLAECSDSPTSPAARTLGDGDASSSTILAAIEARSGQATVPFLSRLLEAPAALVEALVEDAVERGDVARGADGALRSTGRMPQLARWTEAARRDVHSRIARSLPANDASRLPHVVAADLRELPAAVRGVLPRLLAEGRVDRALFWAEAAFRCMTHETDGDTAEELATSALDAALLSGTRVALERVLRLCALAGTASPRLPLVARVARAAVDAIDSNPAGALAALAEVAPGLSGPLRAHAEAVRVVAGRYHSLEQEEAAVRTACAWADENPAAIPSGWVEGWLGWLRYRQGRFRDAAEFHARAAERSLSGSPQQALRLLAAATAWLEVGEPEPARRDAAGAVAIATRNRSAQIEARAAVLADAVAYRMDVDAPIDRHLAETVVDLGVPHLAGEAFLTQAAKSWRAGDLPAAHELAVAAQAQFLRSRTTEAAALAEALASFVAGDRAAGPAREDDIRREASSIPQPGVALQIVGLRAALATPAERASLLPLARSLAAQVAPEIRRIRKEVLSADEAVALVELVPGTAVALRRAPVAPVPSPSPNRGEPE